MGIAIVCIINKHINTHINKHIINKHMYYY